MKTPKRVGQKKDKAGRNILLSDADATALDAFCAQIESCEVDEAGFETWQKAHESIDITVPLFLSASEAENGLSLEVCFVRQIRQSRQEARHGTKEQVKCAVLIPPRCHDGQVIVLTNQGDRCGERTGDLRVIIRFKA